MKVLIPSNFTLASSTVPIDEAQIFTHRIYAIGERVVYNNLIYKRLTVSDTFAAFDNRRIYASGETCSYSGTNYISKLQLDLTAPNIDTTNWQVVTSSAWAVNTAYTVGQVKTYNGQIFACLANHTSPSVDSVKDWVKGQSYSYYTGGYCRYQGRYFKVISSWNWSYYDTVPPFVPRSTFTWWYIPWVEVTGSFLTPATSSMYWMDITHQQWIGNILYNTGSVVIHNSIIYKALNNIVLPTPLADSTRWSVSSTSLPLNTTDWENLGAVNRFKMFDQYISTYTFSNSTMGVSLTDVDFNSIYIGNLFADSVTVSVINNTTSAVVETKTIDLTYDCVDEFDYFFGDWIDNRVPSLKYERTSVYDDVSCQVSFSGDFVRVGIFIIGKSYFIGDEAWEPSLDALDFSVVVEDTSTGEVYLSRGNELKIKSIDLWIDTNRMMATDNILKSARGIPAVYYSENENLDTYGFIRKKTEVLQNPTKSLISIEIRELL